jgi:ABC-2 type transport system ATP-binding protein
MSDLTISLESVSKSYGDFAAVKDLSFSVRKGEIYGFLGQNGAGKTTTLRMLMDIVPPSSGRLMVLGASRPRQVKSRVGYLPEERGLYRKMKAADSIAYFARLKGTPAATAKKRAEALLDRFGLGEFSRSKIEALSKGMAQKVQLLSVIAHEPELLVLDEPFSGLDPVNQQTLEDMILELRAGGRTIVFSTHVMEHAERLCDRFLMIAKGEKVFEGTLAEARAAEGAWLILKTPSDPSSLAGLPEVQAMQARGENRYALKLAQGADSQKILRACLDRGIGIVSFGAEEASLHELFFRFVGAAPEPVAIRQEAA